MSIQGAIGGYTFGALALLREDASDGIYLVDNGNGGIFKIVPGQ